MTYRKKLKSLLDQLEESFKMVNIENPLDKTPNEYFKWLKIQQEFQTVILTLLKEKKNLENEYPSDKEIVWKT